ncbi:MAG: methyltransferase domain-containing protein [Anaerolineae bacterium]|nr:methyltransferase domain-containing protein [Anaerolineae bacterium]
MATYTAETYGERIAGTYDDWYDILDEDTVPTLRELAGDGRALELGIGTGRVALPLQQSGVEVHGIDASQAMVDRLRAKPGGQTIPVTLGDFAGVAVDGEFSLIFALFTTFFSLLTQEDQVRCFQNVARHLSAGGAFVIEAFVPDLARYDRGQDVRASHVGTDEVRLAVSQLDPVSQQITSQQVVLTEEGARLYPVKIRYAWPSELDLMARLAGLELRYRWENWQRAPFTAQSSTHISVYGRA